MEDGGEGEDEKDVDGKEGDRERTVEMKERQ